MRILYEGGPFEILPNGGVARYVAEVVARLPLTVRPIVMLPSETEFPAFHPRLHIEQIRTRPPLRLVRRWWRRRQHRAIRNRMASFTPDVTHWTYYTGLCRQQVEGGIGKTVVTVYDFIHEAFPEQDPGGVHRRWQRAAIESADHICCISQSTFDQLCHRYPHAAEKASVTLLGNSFASVRATPVREGVTTRPYILFVGRRDGYKNFDVVYRAWKNARARQPDLSLVLTGPSFKRRERAQWGISEDAAGVRHLGHVSDGVLKTLYQHCSAFVFPSRMEGFGLPALEAIDSGAAVIASGCDALREVLGDAGYYFDPDDVDALTDHLIAAGNDALPNAQAKRELGRKRAKQFSWHRAAHQTAEVYASLIDQSPKRMAA